MTYTYTMLLLTTMFAANADKVSNVNLSIMGGYNCENGPSNEDFDLNKCQNQFAAELSIDGKVVGSIPLNLLSKEQIEALKDNIKNIRVFSKKEIEDLNNSATQAFEKIK